VGSANGAKRYLCHTAKGEVIKNRHGTSLVLPTLWFRRMVYVNKAPEQPRPLSFCCLLNSAGGSLGMMLLGLACKQEMVAFPPLYHALDGRRGCMLAAILWEWQLLLSTLQ
jgi:hypothetical protein